jgi:uncharacterized BrkB/YihY/UPF0761 family membrane protein
MKRINFWLSRISLVAIVALTLMAARLPGRDRPELSSGHIVGAVIVAIIFTLVLQAVHWSLNQDNREDN